MFSQSKDWRKTCYFYIYKTKTETKTKTQTHGAKCWIFMDFGAKSASDFPVGASVSRWDGM